MAQPQHSFVLVSFFLALSLSSAFSSKSLHFTLYEQETYNKTAYLIFKGVDTGELAPSPYAAPFGTLYAFHDTLTVEANRSSKVVGSIEGTSVISTLDGLQTTSVVKITLNYNNLKGSLSAVGAGPNAEPGDVAIVGGTGDFLFVQGYFTSIPLDLTPPYFVLKTDFHLYWPPYASYRSDV